MDKLSNYLINKNIISKKILNNYINKVNKKISSSIKFAKLSKPPDYKEFLKEYSS